MAKNMISGNQAVGFAALSAGVKTICGYPGTPSSEVIDRLLKMGPFPGTHIEWSINEKVAVEIAATTAWAGKRALCTMKMSGLNVAYDSMIGIAHSGVIGGMVVYVADDPGTSAGMCEQDSRGFALMSDMVMLEPSTVQETYDMVRYAFDLSEELQMPVFVRSVTCVAQSHAAAEIHERVLPDASAPVVKRDINKYAKAGAAMCMAQHMDAIRGLEKGRKIIHNKGLHKLSLGSKGGIGIITSGVTNSYLEEALQIATDNGCDVSQVSTLQAACTVPYPTEEICEMIQHCDTVVIAEELEPYMEREVYVQAQKLGKRVRIIGKLDDTLSRVGSFHAALVADAVCAAYGKRLSKEFLQNGAETATKSLPRPITCCAGCPHRGTYMALNKAIKKAGFKQEDVIVCGDIGCTILGMNPPFDTIWMEISMGASTPCAHGFHFAGVDKPVFATIGDSTFLHGGMPGVVNAVQHDTDITLIVMDNGWTAMTGMQVNPNTQQAFQYPALHNVDILGILQGMGIKHLFVADPFAQAEFVDILGQCLKIKGFKVILARRECAIQSNRRGVKYGRMTVDSEKCIQCNLCIKTTGCPAITMGKNCIEINSSICTGCGLCAGVCPKQAIVKEEIAK
ncbi:MAG: hypothetical protein EOM66_01690 [Clostridia bacterium]|nr:thiamine pyrophosphate-dependent enzyme [Candidatus Pelethousia sp.]NCB30104.1 hypothetical protein [Clostridia bacterium]